MLPLDLHVLSLSLAFILSQDQTLHCKIPLYLVFKNNIIVPLRSVVSFIIYKDRTCCLSLSLQYLKELSLPLVKTAHQRVLQNLPKADAKLELIFITSKFFNHFFKRFFKQL